MLRFLCCARIALGLALLTVALVGGPAVGWAQQDDPFGGDPVGGEAADDDPFGGEPNPDLPADAPARPAPAAKPRKERPVRRFETSKEDILTALDKSITLELTETPLGDVAAFIRDLAKINIEIDKRALEDIGLDEETPVTLKVRKISLRSALRLMLKPLDLTYVVRENALVITTPEEAESELTATVYPIGKLLDPVDPLKDDPIWAGDDLIDVLQNIVRPYTWEEVGGPGSLAMLRNKLIVSQTGEVHDDVAQFLATLVEARKVIVTADARPPKVTSLPRPQGWISEIEKALAKPAECDFVDTPLKDVADFLADGHAIIILIDRRALADVGIGDDTPVTLKVKGVSLEAALRLMLKEIDCTYVIRDEVLLITTPEESESELAMRIFPVYDLVYSDDEDFVASFQFGYGIGDMEYESLIELIIVTVRPTTWEEVGGPGSIEAYNGCLVIAQTKEVFEEIELLLASIRKLKAQYRADAEAVLTQPTRLDEVFVPNLAKLREALDGEVRMLAFKKTTIRDVVKTLSEKHGVPMLIDGRALDDVGIGQANEITATLGGESLGEALRRILKEFDLTWIIRDEVILVTTPEEAESELLTQVYPVRDLVKPIQTDLLGAELGAYDDYPSLIDMLTRTVRPTTWEDVGGPGAIESYPPCFGLVISQTEEVHEEIENLLAQIRKTDAGEAAKPLAEEQAILKDKAGERVHLKVYRLIMREREETVELADVIADLVEPDSWQADDAYYIKPLTGSIIVRHTVAAHRKIDRLLKELDAHAWPSFGGVGGAFGVDSGFNSKDQWGIDAQNGGLGGGLGGGVFDVPDHVRGQIGGFGDLGGNFNFGGRSRPFRRSGLDHSRPWYKGPPPVTTISALSLPAKGESPAMPLAVYHLLVIDDEESPGEIAEAVGDLVSPDDWQAESGVYLRAVGRKLIVRHEAGVHRSVYRLLVKLEAVRRTGKLPPGLCGSVIPVVGQRQSP